MNKTKVKSSDKIQTILDLIHKKTFENKLKWFVGHNVNVYGAIFGLLKIWIYKRVGNPEISINVNGENLLYIRDFVGLNELYKYVQINALDRDKVFDKAIDALKKL